MLFKSADLYLKFRNGNAVPDNRGVIPPYLRANLGKLAIQIRTKPLDFVSAPQLSVQLTYPGVELANFEVKLAEFVAELVDETYYLALHGDQGPLVGPVTTRHRRTRTATT